MLAAYLTGALICVAALVAGQAAMSLCGRERPSPLAPAVGLALLLIVANLAIQLPGRDTAAAIALGVLLLAGLVVLWPRGRRSATFRGLRPRGVRPGTSQSQSSKSRAASPVAAAVTPTLTALIAAFAASIPFLASGRVGPLGQGLVNDDMASHLLFTEWIATGIGQTPDLVQDGYPLAPHSLVAAVGEATGASHVEVFAGLTLALAALAALTGFGALAGARPSLRVIGGVLVSLPYLGAAWLAQGAFKEPMLAFFLVAFALGLREVGRERQVGIPLGLIAAGTLYAYSFPGLAWLAGAALFWWLLQRTPAGGAGAGDPHRAQATAEHGGGGTGDRTRWPVPLAAIGIPLLAALPELGRLIDFAGFGAFDPEGEGPRVGLGNLDNALSPLEGLNVWPASDFRIDAAAASLPAIAFYLGGLLGAVALAWGVLAAIRGRESALLGPLAAGVLGYLGAAAFGTPYTSAKALAIAAPIVMLISLQGLLTLGPAPRRAGRAGRPAVLLTIAALFLGAAALSSFLPLRSAAVGPSDHADQIRGLRDEIDGRRVLFLGRDQFAAWELFGSKVATPILNYYNQKSIGNRYEPTPASVKLDFDAVEPPLLDYYAFVITTRAAHQSAPPFNFELVEETPSYRLWRRNGATPPRETLDEPRGPGAILDCSTPEGRAVVNRGGMAFAGDPPVVGPEAGWQPAPRVTDSRPASQELTLGPGRWAISLQYTATQELRVTAPGLGATLPPNLDFRGPSPFWPAGEIDVPGRGPVRVTVSVDQPPLFGRLIGADSQAFPLAITATRVDRSRIAPIAAACGRYVDWYQPRP